MVIPQNSTSDPLEPASQQLLILPGEKMTLVGICCSSLEVQLEEVEVEASQGRRGVFWRARRE